MPRYTTGLSAKGFRELADKVRRYRNALPEKCEEFARRLAKEGVAIARMNISTHKAILSGELIGSMKFEQGDIIYNGGSYLIYTDCEWAKFVEFGTGVVGENSPHPDEELTGAKWKYDINKHGEKGWWYEYEGKFYWTAGMKARPFMYETAQQLRQISVIAKIAKEVFGDD